MLSLNNLVFGVYPYIALTVFVIGSWIRYDNEQYTWKTDSSQLLSKQGMMLASNLFHVGIIMLFLGHFAGLVLHGHGGKAFAGDDQGCRLERIIVAEALWPEYLFRPGACRQPLTGYLFPGLDEADRDARALSQHRVDDGRNQIKDRFGASFGRTA